MNANPEITKKNVILSFKGVVDSERITNILINAEKVLDKTNPETSIKKKTYTILVEFLQNLFHHTEEGLISEKNSKTVQLYILYDDFNYYIITGNYIRNSNISPLKEWIDKINSLSEPEIKERYLDVLQNAEFSKKGGANLGIIDIIRKSKSTLKYDFDEINDEVSYFELKATIRHIKLNSLILHKTKYTPEIRFENSTGLLQINGRSFPEDAHSFYNPILNWLDNYVLQSAETTYLEVFLEFFNTSSSKYFLEIFKRLKKIETYRNKNITVRWFYEKDDEDMYETGIDYRDISNLNFEIIEK